MSVIEARAEAVAQTVGRVREIERRHGVTAAALELIKAEVTRLAERTELFPPEHFPVSAGRSGDIYRISEDPDWRFALYASAGMPGKAQPPHNHTTWAVISGVYGDEHNVFYDRTDNRGTPGEGTLRRTGELTVKRGNAVGFLPDDFHTIEVMGDRPSLHLHMYGLSLERLPGRVFFQSTSGGACKVFPASPHITVPVVGAAELKAMLSDGRELALLDVREEGVFSQRHLLFAVSCPLSRLEQRILALVPRPSTRIVLIDDGDGLVARAARRLARFGYTNIIALAGGLKSWADAGYELFSGINVPSKAFGEFVEHAEETPRMDAAEIKALMDRGTKMIVLDSRPMDEFEKMNIPGALDCPGAELVHRVFDLAPDPETLVVVNCAGRTRSIIGAQSLINAGIPNKVVALKNGTMGWHLAGLELERGQRRHAGLPTPEGRAKARAAADRVAKRFGVSLIDEARLARFEAEADRVSLYRLDVRSPEEYRAGHLPEFRSAPGGQLVQATDRYVGTRNARLVLMCDTGTRAIMTASWLVQMGWTDVHVLDGAFAATARDGRPLALGDAPVLVAGLADADAMAIDPAALKALLDAGRAVVVDLDTSLAHRAGHIPGAWFAVRSRFAASLAKVGRAEHLVLTSSDGVLARLAAADAAALTDMKTLVLAGGTRAWRAAGLPIETGSARQADTPDDVWYRPYDRADGVEAAMKEYLSWEIDLVDQIRRDGDARFRHVPRP